MWLLDHNLPAKIKGVLAEYGISSDTTYERGWAALKNGELVAAAHAAGVSCILTRDVLFGESAAKALNEYPSIAVVLIKLPQRRGNLYVEAFRMAWARAPIVPQSGQMKTWPN